MTATLGETYATPQTETTAQETSASAGRLSPRRARRAIATRVAHSTGGHRVAIAMLGTLAVVALAGALAQAVAG